MRITHLTHIYIALVVSLLILDFFDSCNGHRMRAKDQAGEESGEFSTNVVKEFTTVMKTNEQVQKQHRTWGQYFEGWNSYLKTATAKLFGGGDSSSSDPVQGGTVVEGLKGKDQQWEKVKLSPIISKSRLTQSELEKEVQKVAKMNNEYIAQIRQEVHVEHKKLLANDKDKDQAKALVVSVVTADPDKEGTAGLPLKKTISDFNKKAEEALEKYYSDQQQHALQKYLDELSSNLARK
eukprot:Filipodium_phascolosomae@DN235_c0_g1_i2.p1